MARGRYDDEDEEDARDRDRGRDWNDDDYDDYDDAPRRTPPPSYLGFSIFIVLCCCWLGGIIAVVHAAQVNSKWNAGDYAGARKASETAKMWCWISFCIGIVLQPTALILQIMAEQKNLGN
jgi:hypothetical protein